MLLNFENTGLVPSLLRFAKLYFNTWRKELSHGVNFSAELAKDDILKSGKKEKAPEETGAEEVEEAVFEMTPKRIAVLLALGVSVPTLMVWNHLGFYVDDILFRGWKKQKVDSPVFIVGNARSGTTWTHRILAQDSANFTSPALWELIFAQAVSWKMLFHKINSIDEKVGGPLQKVITSLDKYLFGQTSLHPIGIWHAEEDEWLMMNISACQLSALIFPLIDDFSDLIYFDSTLKKSGRHAILNYYKSCIQKHLYNRKLLGYSDVRYLSKNPTFTLRLESLVEVFPDAEIVVMVRNPFEAIPSMVSYISQCWAVFASPSVKYPFAQLLTQMCSLHYTYPVEVREKMPKSSRQFTFLHYELCKQDLVKSISSLYRHLGLRISGYMAAALDSEAHYTAQYKSRHEYRLEEVCGQTPNKFIEQHKKAFDMYPGYLDVRFIPNGSSVEMK